MNNNQRRYVMKKVFKLTKGKHINTDEWRLEGEGMICCEGLLEFFTVSKKAHTLYVTVSDKVMPQSYLAEFEDITLFDTLTLSLPHNLRKSWHVDTYLGLDHFLSKEQLSKFYVKMDYE